MGSVAKRHCARGAACYQVRVLKLEEPPKLRTTRRSDICEKCEEELAEGYNSSSAERWKNEVAEAIEAVYANKPASQHVGKASLWDLFSLDKENGGEGKLSDRGAVLRRLDANTLTKLGGWLGDNRDRAVERYGYYTWLDLRNHVGFAAFVDQLPHDLQPPPDTDDGLPLQVWAVRTDGKKWDLNIPIRAELLRLTRRYFSERDYGKLLRIGRHSYRNVRARMDQEGFTLNKITADSLGRIVRGRKRGPNQEP
jgi:hypothetical protein